MTMTIQEVHTVTTPRPLTNPITLTPEDFTKAEAHKNSPQSEEPHLVSEFDPEIRGDYLGYWHWEDSNGNVLSKSFFASMKPESILPLDVDYDGDADYLIHYEGGYTEVSYDVTAQLRSTEIRAMASPPITRDISYWLEDHFPGASAYQTPSEQWTHFVLEAGAFQMYTALADYFESLPNLDPQILQLGVEDVIGRFHGKLIRSVVDEREIERQNKTPPERERWVLEKSLWEILGGNKDAFQARVKQMKDLRQSTKDHKLQADKRIEAIAEKALCTAEKIGKEDGGIGIALDGSALPNGYVTVTNLVVGGPALKSGLKIGDRITHVGNRSVTQLSNEEAFLAGLNSFSCLHCGWTVQHAIAGAFGSTIDITVQRKGHPHTFHIPRNFQLSGLRFAGLIP